MQLFTNPPTGLRLLLLYITVTALLKLGGIADISWKWILIPLGILIAIYLIAFLAGLIAGNKHYKKRVQFWEAFYSRKPNGDREDFNKWL